MPYQVREQELSNIINVLASAACPGTNQPFSNYTPAVRLLVSSMIEHYDFYAAHYQPNPEGDFLRRLLAAFDMLNMEMSTPMLQLTAGGDIIHINQV